MLVQCHNVSLRLSNDSVDRFSVSNIKCMCQNVQLCTVFRSRTDPHFGAVWVINRGPNGDPDMFMQCQNVSLRLSIDSVTRVYVFNIKSMCPCAQNVQLCTVFRGRTDPHLGAVLVINLGNMGPQICLYSATMCY